MTVLSCRQVSGKSTLPFGVENEHKVLVALNAMEMTSQYSSFWRFKSIVEDNKKGHVNLVVVLTRQPDRHGVMDAQVVHYTVVDCVMYIMRDMPASSCVCCHLTLVSKGAHVGSARNIRDRFWLPVIGSLAA